MSRAPAATLGEALFALDQIFGWAGGTMPVELSDGRAFWHRCGIPGSGARLARSVRFHDEQEDIEIRLGVPQSRASAGGVARVSALWARVAGKEQIAHAARFKPLPSMAIGEGSGSQRLLIWALEESVGWSEAVAANKRLAYRFRGVQKHADPDLLWIPAPGTCLRDGRARPAPVRCTRLETSTFRLERFKATRWFKDPPVPQWMTG